jgi:hypothetical protein
MKQKLLALAALAPALASAQIVQWTFDEAASNTAANTGSLSGYTLTTRDSANAGANLRTAPGVSGLGNAIDFSAGATMGNSSGPYAFNNTQTIGALSALTVTGWFKTDGAQTLSSGTATLLRNYTSGANATGFQITTTSNNRLQIALGSGSGASTFSSLSNDALMSQASTWVFFAVTWNGSSVQWYVGDEDAPVTVSGTSGAYTGSLGAGPNSIVLGRSGSTGTSAQGFDGLLDDIRIYDSALGLSQIEAVRASAIPEPSAFAALGGLAALGLAASRRRRRA